jgi:hypothetical protein
MANAESIDDRINQLIAGFAFAIDGEESWPAAL